MWGWLMWLFGHRTPNRRATDTASLERREKELEIRSGLNDVAARANYLEIQAELERIREQRRRAERNQVDNR